MSVEFEVVTSTGTYMKDGEEKKRWLKCGVIFKSEKRKLQHETGSDTHQAE